MGPQGASKQHIVLTWWKVHTEVCECLRYVAKEPLVFCDLFHLNDVWIELSLLLLLCEVIK